MTVPTKAAACRAGQPRMLQIADYKAGPRPRFVAVWNGRQIAIELDSSALLKLRGSTPGIAVDKHLPEIAIPKVQAAASRMISSDELGDTPEVILLTALDLD